MQLKKFEDLQQAELTVAMGGQTIHVSVFLIDQLLIDTGPVRKMKKLIPLFEQWKMEKAIITHHHEDHSGLGNWIIKNKQIPIYMHEKGVRLCQKTDYLPFYRRVFWGKREPFTASPTNDVFYTENYEWDIIHSPGHADDHIALYNREKGWMFGGDLYVYPKPKSMYAFESLPSMIESLQKIVTYDFHTYICSHGGVLADGKRRIKEKLNYLLKVQEDVLRLYNKGFTAKEIRKQLFPHRHIMHYISMFENSPIHLINSVIRDSK